MSEALILTSTNPQYDDILFIELQVQYVKIPSSELGENMLCTENDFDIQNNLCIQHVLPMFCKNKSFWQRFTCKKKLSLCYKFSFFIRTNKKKTVKLGSYWKQIYRGIELEPSCPLIEDSDQEAVKGCRTLSSEVPNSSKNWNVFLS